MNTHRKHIEKVNEYHQDFVFITPSFGKLDFKKINLNIILMEDLTLSAIITTSTPSLIILIKK